MNKRPLPGSTHSDSELLGEATWTVSELATDFKPRWRHANKIAVALLATPPNALHDGEVRASRWRGAGAPEILCTPESIVPKRGFFTYPEPSADDDTTHWHLNFADPFLFGYGEGSLLAQDELQITEHPCLASVAYAIESGLHGQGGLTRRTQEGGEATPVLIEGAPRRCSLDTTHLYGDLFGGASTNQVQAATKVLNPPTRSNILALAALRPSFGEYTEEQIRELFMIAHAGSSAIVRRSGRATLHTGHWGCGAFGGNKGLVAAIQLLAAGTAGVERVCFWWGHTGLDHSSLEHAIAVAERLNGSTLEDAVGRLTRARYCWGEANENHVPYEPPKCCLLADVQGRPPESDFSGPSLG